MYKMMLVNTALLKLDCLCAYTRFKIKDDSNLTYEHYEHLQCLNTVPAAADLASTSFSCLCASNTNSAICTNELIIKCAALNCYKNPFKGKCNCGKETEPECIPCKQYIKGTLMNKIATILTDEKACCIPKI